MSNRGINWATALELPRGHKAVLVAMADSANQYMATWQKRETIAKRTGYSKDTVRDYQNEMVKSGHLIAVPWQTEKGADAAPGHFLGCVRELFDEMPPIEVAFAKRINFRGAGKGGSARGFIPPWWSGERVGSGHRCTACGGVCHGSDDPEEPGFIDPGEGRQETTLEGRQETTLEGRQDATLPGWSGSDPFNPKEGKSQGVIPNPRAPAEALARSLPVNERVELSLGGGSGGRVETDAADPAADASRLPAGHGAKTAPRERMTRNQQPESTPPLRLSPEEKRQREQGTIEAAIAAVESSRSPEDAHRLIEFSLMALGWADEQAVATGHAEALAAIREPRWTSAETTGRYDRQIAAHTLLAVLSTRPLAEWPQAILEPLGLGAEAAAAA